MTHDLTALADELDREVNRAGLEWCYGPLLQKAVTALRAAAVQGELCGWQSRINGGFWSFIGWEPTQAELQEAPECFRAVYTAAVQGEPVAWQWYFGGSWHTVDHRDVTDPEGYARSQNKVVRAIYSAPPPAAGWDDKRLREIAQDASLRAAKNASVAPQLLYAPILWALQDALRTAPAATKSADAGGEDWRDDPSADERWNAGLDFAMQQICKALDVDPAKVTWDAATETVDGDVQSVIWNILRTRFGEDWDPDEALSTHPHASDCDKQGATKSEGGDGDSSPGEAIPGSSRQVRARCCTMPGDDVAANVAVSPSDRTADVTWGELHAFILQNSESWEDEGVAARALLDTFTVGRR